MTRDAWRRRPAIDALKSYQIAASFGAVGAALGARRGCELAAVSCHLTDRGQPINGPRPPRQRSKVSFGAIRAVAGWPCPLSPSYAQIPIHARFLQPRR